MNRHTSGGSWRRLKDHLKAWPGRHPGVDGAPAGAGRERQAAVIQERYGVSREVARKLLDQWEKTLRH